MKPPPSCFRSGDLFRPQSHAENDCGRCDLQVECGKPAPRGILSPEAQRKFLLAGNATFTVVSRKTGARFTFKAKSPREQTNPEVPVTHILVLSGPDNTDDYQYVGTIFGGPQPRYSHGVRARIGAEAPSAQAARWVCSRLAVEGKDLPNTDFFHEGRCGRCGRKLTVPESIESGFGPECLSLA